MKLWLNEHIKNENQNAPDPWEIGRKHRPTT